MNKQLFQRASKVIPGGIPGHQSPVFTVPGRFPYFAKSASGAVYWDADDRELIDFLGGYGPLVLGANRPEVVAAVAEAEAGGVCFNHPTEWTVRLAERLVELVDFADWAFFGKNGADMTYWAIRVAREHTGRSKVLRFRHAYHGTEPWCSDNPAGVTAADRVDVLETPWNDVSALRACFQTHGKDIAAVISTPFDHPNYADMSLPDPLFLAAIREALDTFGGLWVLDDVRCGFRHHLGGSHRYFGFSPDLSCFSKAIANGYALSACVGRAAIRPAASRVFATGSFWNNPGPLAAAMKTLEILEAEDAIASIHKNGQAWIDGFLRLGAKHGLELVASGTPAMPFLRVAEDPGFQKQQAFCCAALEAGVFLHPHHNWFLGHAHTSALLEASLERIEVAMQHYLKEAESP